MSRRVVVECDQPQCLGTFRGTSATATFEELVAESIGFGWTTVAGRHYCDVHPQPGKRKAEVTVRHAAIRRVFNEMAEDYEGHDLYGEVAARCHVGRATVGRAVQARLGTIELEPVDRDEGAEILDRASRRLLNISGADFTDRLQRNDVAGLDHTAVMKLAMLLPLSGR